MKKIPNSKIVLRQLRILRARDFQSYQIFAISLSFFSVGTIQLSYMTFNNNFEEGNILFNNSVVVTSKAYCGTEYTTRNCSSMSLYFIPWSLSIHISICMGVQYNRQHIKMKTALFWLNFAKLIIIVVRASSIFEVNRQCEIGAGFSQPQSNSE